MTERLTSAGYEQTKRKLADLQARLAEIENRTDLKPQHHAQVVRSYRRMIAQYTAEMKVYEASQKAAS